jgi:hypothetical protein
VGRDIANQVRVHVCNRYPTLVLYRRDCGRSVVLRAGRARCAMNAAVKLPVSVAVSDVPAPRLLDDYLSITRG